MLQAGRYVFKRADAADEFEQIHRLNYRTFVEEIPQHAASPRGRLVDKFHAKSTYIVALFEGRVVGMLSVHDQPPFSVADRLSDPSILNAPGRRPMEVRLLAVDPQHRTGPVLAGLLYSTLEHARDRYTDVYISGVAGRVEMYRRIGFEPLGPAVASGAATFVPMRVTLPLQASVEKLARLWSSRIGRSTPRTDGRRICMLPGPVAVAPAVRAAFESRPVSHRHPDFIARFEDLRRALGRLTHSRQVALVQGGGTLANDVIAATLAAEIEQALPRKKDQRPTRGAILVNGEFGRRLVRQAARFGLRPRVVTWEWGRPWNLAEVEAALDDEPPGSWIWGVHLESSTGVLNDLEGLVRVAQQRGVRVCADCISSLGAVELDLAGVYLASGAAGKSLGAYAGIAMVFAGAPGMPRLNHSRLPSYLDLPEMLATVGPRYTFASPTFAALEAALVDYASQSSAAARYKRYAELGACLRGGLREVGIAPLADDAIASGVLTTFAPPGGESAESFVERAAAAGFDIGGQSEYLTRRRLVQVATMGATTCDDVAAFISYLSGRALPTRPQAQRIGARQREPRAVSRS